MFSLFEWRDARARRIDIPPFKIIGNSQMLDLATTPPDDLSDLAARVGLGPRFARRWGREVVALLSSPRRAPEWQRSRRAEPLPAVVRKRLERLTAARDRIAEGLGLPGGLVCPKATLVSVAELSVPWSRSRIEAVGLVGWRHEQLADAFATSVEGL